MTDIPIHNASGLMSLIQELVGNAQASAQVPTEAKAEWRQVESKLAPQIGDIKPGIVARWVDGEHPSILRLELTSETVASLKFELGFAAAGSGKPVTHYSFTRPHGAGTASPKSSSFLDDGLVGLHTFLQTHKEGKLQGSLLG